MIYRVSITFVLALLLFVASLAALGQLSASAQNTACYIQQGGAGWVAASGCTWDVQSGATLNVDGTLTIDGVTESGPTLFGAQTAATDGLTITHGLGTTPTVVFLQPAWSSAAVTQTIYPGNVGDTTFSIEFTTGAVTNTTVYWQVGK
jgi:hypothetical protein